ncbi:bifunctional hydroxymethylpyrimidine kinase/phosphomethylpyrimidine kinase [Vallitalea okinawensis]|uniref:bifunctional hydroxymethylpyrimidine kinase/phosphomethylpyrimidine kinase n=1 Tax=Vallitalea okinawensis TaxID=2078660 RepID=UPI000CFC7415|nr:bifunctional hydroxymethylpyrimidine kinase/phosphomethylpyrimidine kinase [Vallitalea okinawensis]
MKKVLTIAGSDCSGGAGIQADLKTIMAHGCYGMSVITALTAQNTTGVYGIEECTTAFVKNQMDCVFTDIPPDSVKIGMVASKDIIETIAEGLKKYQPKHMVVDPVMVATSGSLLLEESAMTALCSRLLPLATVITPNLYEAALLSDMTIQTTDDMMKAAKKISEMVNGSILIKGGHLEEHANDLLYSDGQYYWIEGHRVDNANTHGTGCTLSSAIASNLALGYSLEECVRRSKSFITGAIEDQMDLGKGRGPLNHCYQIIQAMNK